MSNSMRYALAAALLAALFGFAQPPSEPALPEPDIRLVYESDTRAYYRPCG
jgi:hypothetical protein